MTYAEKALPVLNAIPISEYRSDWWDEYIYPLPGYDSEATAVADPNGDSTLIVFTDLSRCKWDGDSKTWEIERPTPPSRPYPTM